MQFKDAAYEIMKQAGGTAGSVKAVAGACGGSFTEQRIGAGNAVS
jgi:tRNA A37 threonylcarbamoyladenosine modification protein TsaB